MADPKKLPEDTHLEQSRKLLGEMDGLLQRVKILIQDTAKPIVVDASDGPDAKK